MLQVLAQIFAKSPPAILIVLGVLLYLLQHSGLGIGLIIAGIGLNILWLFR